MVKLQKAVRVDSQLELEAFAALSGTKFTFDVRQIDGGGAVVIFTSEEDVDVSKRDAD